MSKVRVSPAATRRQNVRIAAAVAATALGSGFFGGGIARADLVLDWKGDNYSSGNWVDSVSGTVATVQGSPTAILNAFGTHTGVQTGNGGNFFTVAGGKAPGNLQNFTLAAVFQPTSTGANGGNNYWQSSGLIGMEEGGVVNDWGLGYGDTTGDHAIAGVGAPAPGVGGDQSIASGSLAVGTSHVAVFQVNGAAGTETLFVDGAQVATRNIGAIAKRNPDTYALGAITSGGANPFSGYLGELQIYNDATVSGSTLSQSLYSTYVLGLTGTNTWLNGDGNYNTPGNWSAGHIPASSEQSVIPNGTLTVNSDVGASIGTQITKGGLTFVTGGALNTAIDLAPTTGNTSTLALNGGTLTTRLIQIDTGNGNGPGTKVISFNGGTLAATGTFTVSGTNVTTSAGASGATFDIQGANTVTWAPVLTPAAGATLNKIGTGTLSLTGGGFASKVNVRAGTLNLAGNAGVAGSTIQIGDNSVSGGDTATLGITAPATVTGPIGVGTPGGGGGTYAFSVAGNNAVNVTGPVTLNAGLTVNTAATTGTNATTFAGGFSAASGIGALLTFNDVGAVNVNTVGINDGAGSVTLSKNGRGTLTIAAASNYSGGTTIDGGSIVFTAPNTIGGTGPNVQVNAGGVAVAGAGFPAGNLTGTFLSRIANGSSGVVALSADSAENFDFTNFPSLFLGAATNVTYTGTITPASGVYQLGGGGGNLILAKTNAVTGGTSLVVGPLGGTVPGTVTLANPNDFAGGATVNAGNSLAVANGDRLGNGSVTLNGGILQVIGTAPATINNSITAGAGGTIRVDNASATFTADLTSVFGGALVKSGTGTANFIGNVNTGDNPALFNEGTVVFGGTSTFNTNQYFSIGQGASNVATVILQGTATATVGSDFNVSDTQNSVGKLFIRDNAAITAKTLYVGKNNTSEGSVLQTGGSVTNQVAPGDWRIGGGGGAGDVNAVGSYTMTGGSITTSAGFLQGNGELGNFQIGAFGRGTMTMTGGTVIVSGYPDVGRFNGGYGVLTVNGGSFSQTNAATLFIVGESGTGRLNVGGATAATGGVVNVAGNLRIGLNADGEGHVNLNANGTIVTPSVSAGASTNGSSLNFHGGTLRAASAGTLIGAGVNTILYSEGGVIDTNGNDVTINTAFKAPTGNGLSSIALASGGAGYVSHPLVEISGGGGKGATAIPVLDASGVVTGIQITNPGTGYTSAPTIALKGSGSTTPATLGVAAIAPNVGGGFTKAGAGTLTLATPGHSYTGTTVIAGGTLKLGANVAVAPTANWVADSLTGTTGSQISAWTDSIAGKTATPNGTNDVPTLTVGGLGGHKTVTFNNATAQSLQVAAGDSPISGASDFSIAVVFKTATPGVGGEGQWYQNTGLVDSEEPGQVADWGVVLNSNGRVGAGIGSPDATAYSQTGLANGSGHIAIYSRNGTTGAVTLNVDGQSFGTAGSTAARNLQRFLFGGIQTNGNFYTGDLAQVEMFGAALSPLQINSLGSTLASTYGLTTNFASGAILPTATPINITAAGATLDLSDNTVTVGSLSGVAGGQILLGSGTLTVGNDNGTAAFAGTIAGTGGLTKVGTGTQTLSASNHTYTGATMVNGGVLSVTGSVLNSSGVSANTGGTFEAAAKQTVKALTVTTGGTARVANPAGGAKFALTVGDGTPAANPLAITGGTVDLITNGLIVDVAPGAEGATLKSVRQQIVAGYNATGAGNNGDFKGNGITSSNAAADKSRAVGYALSTELTTPTSFLGSTVDASSVVARYTLAGDATLDGTVDFNDLVKLAQNYNTAVSSTTDSWWTHGDFTYDGVTDFNDLVKLAQNYNTALPTEAIPGAPANFDAELARAFASVPEPGAFGLAAIAACGLAARRRRRRD